MISERLQKRSYVPQRDGLSDSRWQTVGGTPVLSPDRVTLSASTVSEKSDIAKGNLKLRISIPAVPTSGDDRVFGLKNQADGSSAVFQISGTAFTAEVSDHKGNTESTTLAFDSAWIGVETEFEIVYSPSFVRFRVAGTPVAEFGSTGTPNQSMSVYIENGNVDTFYFFGYDFGGFATDITSGGSGTSQVEIEGTGTDYAHYQNDSFTTINVKDSAGRVYSASITNTTGGTLYFQIHNTATTPAGAAVPKFKVLVPANGAVIVGNDLFGPNGMEFDAGIAIAASSTLGTYTAASAGNLTCDLFFDGAGGASGYILNEDGSGLLMENGDFIALED